MSLNRRESSLTPPISSIRKPTLRLKQFYPVWWELTYLNVKGVTFNVLYVGFFSNHACDADSWMQLR